MKTALFLIGDYWHPAETVRPLAARLFPSEAWHVVVTEVPQALFELEGAPDLIMTLKDPVENNQIPTPVWCGEDWMKRLFAYVGEQGTGLLAVHAALAGTDREHPMAKELLQAVFTGHPAACPVTFQPAKAHAILGGVSAFTFPENDEHYMMAMLDGAEVDILAHTLSQHGSQPGLWVKEWRKGRVCCVSPGHTTANLLCDDYVKLLKNAIRWCIRA